MEGKLFGLWVFIHKDLSNLLLLIKASDFQERQREVGPLVCCQT
jgi:hypothetical protein